MGQKAYPHLLAKNPGSVYQQHSCRLRSLQSTVKGQSGAARCFLQCLMMINRAFMVKVRVKEAAWEASAGHLAEL